MMQPAVAEGSERSCVLSWKRGGGKGIDDRGDVGNNIYYILKRRQFIIGTTTVYIT